MASNVIPSDSPSIYASLSSLSGQATLRALVLPNGSPPAGIAGFIFDIPEEEQFLLESDITDHYVESNLAVADQIALRPEKITLRGLVAELNEANLGVSGLNSIIPNALPLIESYIPALSPAATEFVSVQQAVALGSQAATVGTATNLLSFYLGQSLTVQPNESDPSSQSFITSTVSSLSPLTGSLINTSQSILNTYSNNPANQTQAQSSAFGFFYQLWLGRMIFTVETPWGIMESMAIESARIVQPEDSPSVSELEVVFKKIRVVQSLVQPLPGTLAGRAVFEANESSPVNLGNIGQTPLTSLDQTQFYNAAQYGGVVNATGTSLP